MAIKGHKERALLRRGYQVQEALQRRPLLNENSFLRRNLILEYEDIDEGLNLYQLCDKERKSGN